MYSSSLRTIEEEIISSRDSTWISAWKLKKNK